MVGKHERTLNLLLELFAETRKLVVYQTKPAPRDLRYRTSVGRDVRKAFQYNSWRTHRLEEDADEVQSDHNPE